ncbi:peptidase domain-containing ABC transporter [Paenactinomyces guangxiensis]|uniref:Peptidase domain-containing ABC transporter n=1 Tax=Paenactinomyces guangxiensis TaxID=1490290 RepID=A0A7W1WPU4_9BACL|nr:peptidase domain-containing ABC transporter [Paenactinomyces guangxiensis]MBA4493815.1 peptidase domain-containing ABC transporter [Paenactinomyces guangxiensis]MBH8591281.1 peptidase domain-containing ABC transporter [Paenactinomyces guangxiensis]
MKEIYHTLSSQVKRVRRLQERWGSFFSYVFRYPRAVITIFLLTLLAQLASLLVPFSIQFFVDHLWASGKIDWLHLLGMGVFILFASHLLISYVRVSGTVSLQAKISLNLSGDFLHHLLNLPYPALEKRASGDLAARFNNITAAREILANHGAALILDLMMCLVYSIAMFFYSVKLAGITIVIAAIQMMITALFVPATQRRTKEELKTYSETQSYLVEVLRSMLLVKSNSLEDTVFNGWFQRFTRQIKAFTSRYQLSGCLNSMIQSIQLVTPLLLLWLGAKEVMAQQMTIGSLVALIALATSFLIPIGSLTSSIQSLQFLGGIFERLQEIFGEKVEQIPPGAVERGHFGQPLRMERVTFSYQPNGPPVLNQVSFHLNPGEKIALVGATGSGKTTILKLILGLYKPTQGSVTLGGIPLTELNIYQYRQQIGVVLQETFLFNDTIAKNIAFFQEVSQEDVEWAAKTALLHEEIVKMPEGYNTVIGENGQNLSGGQRQRLAIARALYRKPALLILDEATSQLDTITEQKLHEQLDSHQITRIVIAHRLFTIQDANRIFVIKEGRVKEEGTHQELIEWGGIYKELWERHTQQVENARYSTVTSSKS